MIGAIIGDIVGSRYERYNHKSKDFELFDKKCHPTDDSIMSLAIAKAILGSEDDADSLPNNAIACMQELGRIYRNAGYGKTFNMWIMSEKPLPYNSYGNGSAMRVSPCGYAADSIEKAKELSSAVTKVSHDHPEGMKGAEAIAVAIYLAKTGVSKENIRNYIEENYYKLDFKIDDIRDTYKFDVSCQGSVPHALEAFFESEDFEDAIRIAVSIGGDSDTIAAMAGSVAEAYYGVPEELVYGVMDYLDSREMEILYYFEKKYSSNAILEDGHTIVSLFEVLDEAVDKVFPEGSEVHVDEVYPDGTFRVSVDNESLVPDFSSFDQHEEEIKDVFTIAGEEVARTARMAGRGLFTAIKSAKNNIDTSRDMIELDLEKWYEIVPEDSEDTEDIIYAVEHLRDEADDVSTDIHILSSDVENAVHWFLDDKVDTRSSNFLEDAATEIQVQGLELDYTCVLWDADMRVENGEWHYYSFNGNTKWIEQIGNTENKQDKLKYMLNAYRVLLTRARAGMVICVPEGNPNKTPTGFWEDSTRLPEYYDGTYEYLKSIGLQEI